jgi:hypothetical protein
MRRRKLLAFVAVMGGVGMAAPVSLTATMPVGEGSNRKVLTCNVDGTYTCANERCQPGYCCQIGG